MHGYRELQTDADLEALCRRMRGFHDALVKEVRIVERAWADRAGAMHHSGRLDVRLVVQSQWELRALELLAIRVRDLRLQGQDDPVCATGRIARVRVAAPVERTQCRVELEGACTFTCERLFVVERPDWHGPHARLHGEVPAPDAVRARDLGHGCRQCTECAQEFAANGASPFQYCPGCDRLTELTAADGP